MIHNQAIPLFPLRILANTSNLFYAGSNGSNKTTHGVGRNYNKNSNYDEINYISKRLILLRKRWYLIRFGFYPNRYTVYFEMLNIDSKLIVQTFPRRDQVQDGRQKANKTTHGVGRTERPNDREENILGKPWRTSSNTTMSLWSRSYSKLGLWLCPKVPLRCSLRLPIVNILASS